MHTDKLMQNFKTMSKNKKLSAWTWVPSLYFAEGIPYVIVMTVSVIMYKRMGISNTDIALYTSWLYLPWVIKPFWSPVVDLLKTKRWWIVIMQLFIGGGLAGVALTIPMSSFFQYSLAFFWLLAFSSATHDIAADGFYMLALDEHKQAYFIGIRSTFYRLAMITGQGLLIILAGFIESNTGLEPVNFNIKTQQNSTEWVVPKFNIDTNKTLDKQHFIISSSNYDLGLNKLSATKASEIKKWAHKENISNNFVENDKISTKKTSWWTENVSKPLKHKLQKTFGTKNDTKTTNTTQGNIAIVGIRLAIAPKDDEKIVINIDRQKGDKNLSLIEGQRLVFNAQNWNKPAWVLIQADSKLSKITNTSFKGLSGDIPLAWTITFIILSGLFIVFMIYHKFMLPTPESDIATGSGKDMIKEFFATFSSFFTKENAGISIAFILLFRLGESQLVKLASPFLLDAREQGGLGLTTGDIGLIYGTIGILFLTIGGILGGWLAARNGLKHWIWLMVLAINLPNLAYVYLAMFTPDNIWLISSAVALEQFGYGFGFTAYMLYMIYYSEGKNKTAHYAISTGLMALGMMIPGMISGWLQEILGYSNFFIWVMICTIPGFIIVKFLKIDKEFGKKHD